MVGIGGLIGLSQLNAHGFRINSLISGEPVSSDEEEDSTSSAERKQRTKQQQQQQQVVHADEKEQAPPANDEQVSGGGPAGVADKLRREGRSDTTGDESSGDNPSFRRGPAAGERGRAGAGAGALSSASASEDERAAESPPSKGGRGMQQQLATARATPKLQKLLGSDAATRPRKRSVTLGDGPDAARAGAGAAGETSGAGNAAPASSTPGMNKVSKFFGTVISQDTASALAQSKARDFFFSFSFVC